MGARDANNFDLLRFLASLQVAVYHSWVILQWSKESHGGFWKWWGLFPGVPVFFCISGFLISQSVERNRQRISAYFEGRILRIYPALVSVTCLGAVMLFVLGYFQGVAVWRLCLWFLTTALFGSTVNPDFLRSFGVGAWNGSLWTIPVEISFYLFLPFVILLFGSRKRLLDGFLIVTLIVSFGLFIASDGAHFYENKSPGALSKIVQFSLAGNLWMFLFGALASRHLESIRGLIRGKVLIWLLLLVSVAYLSDVQWPFAVKVLKVFTLRFLLAGFTLSAAFSLPGLSQQLLRGQDISYGLYLYHAPVYNLFRHFGLWHSVVWAVLALVTALGAGILSWFAVEKRALAMKGRLFSQIADKPPRPESACNTEARVQ